MKDTRTCLDSPVTLYRRESGDDFPVTFSIDDIVSAGHDTISYAAHHEMSGRGTLREFYPLWAGSLQRGDDGHLFLTFARRAASFLNAREEYLQAHLSLLKLLQDEKGSELSSCIPPFEVFYGAGTAQTVYIWIPDPSLISFAQVCDRIHQSPSIRPEYNLRLLLRAIKKLTSFAGNLHQHQLAFCDLTPETFGFRISGEEILTDTVTLLDMDSICPAPGDAAYQADLFSIGTILFHALVIGKNGESVRYRNSMYHRLKPYVKASPLLGASEAVSHPGFRDILLHILQKCLAPDPLGYSSCEDLLKDLDDALYFLLPYEITQKNSRSEKWILSDPDSVDMASIREALAYHLYRYPVYQAASEQNDHIYVSVLGFGIYARAFLDVCLQAGQVLGKHLTVTVYEQEPDKESEDLSGAEQYLKERPALSGFFTVSMETASDAEKNSTVFLSADAKSDPGSSCVTEKDNVGTSSGTKKDISGSSPGTRKSDPESSSGTKKSDPESSSGKPEDSYGTIIFRQGAFAGNSMNSKEQTAQIENLFFEAEEHGCAPHFVFISLGEDELNAQTALACREVCELIRPGTAIHYVTEDRKKQYTQDPLLIPVRVLEDITEKEDYGELERMAFNTHLIWKKDLNIDFRKARQEFRKPYNFHSCLSSMLSIRAKLFSLGIPMEIGGYEAAARAFLAYMEQHGAAARNQLIWLEHKRWVIEKLCSGWRPFENLSDCLEYHGKDERGRRHCCIRRSRPDQLLAEEFSGSHLSRWDKAGKAELARLDELDRMSVELHRLYAKAAGAAKNTNLPDGDAVHAILNLIDGNDRCLFAFQEWYACLKNLWNGDRSVIRLYRPLKDAFSQEAKVLNQRSRLLLQKQLHLLDVQFSPVVYALEYRDYKQDDVALVDNIPFILTYSDNIYMAVPWQSGNNTAVFQNVAAAAALHPGRLLYMIYLESPGDLQDILETLPCAVEFLKKKQVLPVLEFVAATTAHLTFEEKKKQENAILSRLRAVSGNMVRQLRLIDGVTDDTVSNAFSDYLLQRRKNKDLFIIEQNRSPLSSFLRGSGFYEQFDYFRYDPVKMEFTLLKGCGCLACISKKPYMSVADMTAFGMSVSKSDSQPEFFANYQELWNTYKKNRNGWKALCDLLDAHAKEQDVLAIFRVSKAGNASAEDTCCITYLLPFACYETVRKIVRALKDNRAAFQESHVTGITSDACEVTISTTKDMKAQADRLFADPYLLMQPGAISFDVLSTHSDVTVTVQHDSLLVRSLVLPDAQKASRIELLRYFEKIHFIHHLTVEGNTVGFVYETWQIRQLLTMAGRILEIYVYHKAKETGKFGDIVSGYEMQWEGTEVKNELDCIITRGFTMLFIECKARKTLSQDFYYKLSGLVQKFGIHARAVLIADTAEKNADYDNARPNAVQRRRGNMMDVVTVWDEKEIDDIGNTLLSISDGTYVQKEWERYDSNL